MVSAHKQIMLIIGISGNSNMSAFQQIRARLVAYVPGFTIKSNTDRENIIESIGNVIKESGGGIDKRSVFVERNQPASIVYKLTIPNKELLGKLKDKIVRSQNNVVSGVSTFTIE